MQIDHLDHLVLTVADITATCAFYEQVLGMQVVTFDGGRKALHFGNQKINLHQAGGNMTLVARQPTTGSADLCFITYTPLETVIEHLTRHNVSMEAGIVERTGAQGAIRSVYFRDPDGNLLEVSQYIED